MKPASASSPAQQLVEFFKKTEDSDLILAKKVKEKTILYSKKPDLLHSLRKYFSNDYAKEVQRKRDLARKTITEFVDQGRHGDHLSEASATKIKLFLTTSQGDVKAGKLKGLFTSVDTQTLLRREWECSANQAWDRCHQQISDQLGEKDSQALHIMAAIADLKDEDLTTLKNLITKQSPANEDLIALHKELDAGFSALGRLMKNKGTTQFDRIDYQSIHALGIAWARARPDIKNIDNTLREANPLGATCLYLSVLARAISREDITAVTIQNALPTSVQSDTSPSERKVDYTQADASLNEFLQGMGKR